MSNVFSLDKLREDVEKEFAPVKITVSDGTEVTLRNLLRLPKKDRDAVVEKLKRLELFGDESVETKEDDVETLVQAATEILVLVSDQGRKLQKELDGDLALTMRVLETWMSVTQAGEAQPSPNS